MTEQRWFHSPLSDAAQPVSPKPQQTRIPTQWSEGAVITILIRHPHQTAPEDFYQNMKPGCGQEYQALLILHLEARKFFASRPERRAI
jgi:hypothetical protein